MCEFHDSDGNVFEDIWQTDKLIYFSSILTTNLAVFVCAQNFTNFSPYALISSPNVPKILFA